ncbi:uncharacterized protein LOC134263747 [Saccostrea cucullata]|uniref:uncharacterized protein LOC134263747 n=1 Tax=Saccostrea cuccullata TaxID=36930 RepID=UPI002ED1ED82
MSYRKEDSLLLESFSEKHRHADFERELTEHFRKLGFYREVPTPDLLREAQQVYHTLDWPQQFDDDGDPLPGPPSSSRDEILNPDEVKELDEHALQTPTTYLGQHLRYLVEYLIRPAISDVHKARVLTRWLGRCMDEDYIKYLPRTEWSHPESVAGYVWKLRKRQIDYDEFFQTLCTYAGLKAKNVDGCVRNTIKYEVGKDFMEQRKSWTAVLLDGNWRLLDVRWICEAAYGVAKTNWRLIEDEKGKVDTSKAIKENRNTFKTQCRFREFYFLTDPEIFIYDHFPDDSKWQLLARNVSYKEAKEMAALRADFFRNKMVLRTHPKCITESDDGIVKLNIGLQEDTRMSFVYKLYRSKNSKMPIDPSRKELDRYVFMERDIDECEVRSEIRCPAEGEYLFELHGSQNIESCHALLVTYFIRCTGIKGVITPLPPNIRQEWGPGEDTRDMGMVPVTHRKGQVEADDGETEITFTLEKDLEFKHDLVKGDQDISVTDGHVVHTIENGKMNISLRLPSPGEYALNVMAKEKFKKTRFAPACSYLVSCDDEPLQTKPLPNIDGRHIGTHEKFHELGFKEDNAWTSYINNLVTGEFSMQIHKPHDIFVMASLELEEGDKSETFDNYVVCDTQDNKVKVTAIFPKSGTYKLTLYARLDTVQDDNKYITIYTKIIEVVLPTLAGMPSPIQSSIPDWCHGYHLKEPRSMFLPSGEMTKISVSVPEAHTIKVKGHPECHLKQNEEGYWEGYLKTGPPRSTVDLLASESLHGQPFKQVVSKEELLQIEVEQEGLFKRALDELESLEEEKYARLLSRLKQAVKDRNRQKLQKLLYRAKELKPDKVDVEIVRAERVLRELVDLEEKDIARKELRKATRMCDIPSLEAVLQKVKRLRLPEEDGDITAAEEVLQSLREKQDAALGKTRDKSQQTTETPTPYFYGNHSGVHIYVMPDGRVQHSEIAPDNSVLQSSRLTRDADVQTLDSSADEEIKEDFSYLAMDSSTPRKTRKTDTSKVPELLRQHLKKRHLMEDEIDAEDIEPTALGALSMIDQEENGDRSYTSRGGSRSWKSRTMEVFKKYWHVMKEKSELTRQTLNDDIENEVQRLKHINQMCRKMSRAARRIGMNYNSLIDSEQMFHDILNEPNDQNDSLTEDLCNTSALQQDVIIVEEGLKSAFEEFVKRMDELCAELVIKAENTAKELERTRLEMATEDIMTTSSKSSLRSDSGVGGSTDRDHPDYVKTSFYAAKNTILEDLKSTNASTEEDIRRQLSALQKQMADYHHGNTSSHVGNHSGNHSGLFSNSWKL